MDKIFIARQSIIINVSAANVWDALINPEMIKKYLFGTEAVSDWKEGSTIKFKGMWEGKPYEDKGIILKIEPEKLLDTSYWSGFSGLPDSPENYSNVTYRLEIVKGGTRLIITQDHNATADDKDRSEQNWKMVLDSLKKLLEKQ